MLEPGLKQAQQTHARGSAAQATGHLPSRAHGSSCRLTSVLGSQPQHESHGEDLGPGGFPLLYEDPEKVGWVGQQQLLQGLEGGADVEEAAVLLAAQEAPGEEGVAQLAQHVT